LGFECAKAIAKSLEWHVVIASRNAAKSAQAVEYLKTHTRNPHIQAIPLNLSSLASVREFAAALPSYNIPPLHALVCNAGVQVISHTQRTQDGFEMTFGVNHLGHFLLTLLVLPHLAAPARIVVVSSGTHDPAQKTFMPPPNYTNARDLAFPPTDEILSGRGIEYLGRQRYSTSKLCNVLFNYELARRLQALNKLESHDAICVNAFDPGLMPGTGLAGDYPPLQKIIWAALLPLLIPFIHNVNTPSRSAQALARLILNPHLQNVTGKYFEGPKEIPSSKESYDLNKAKDLWDTSMELVGPPATAAA